MINELRTMCKGWILDPVRTMLRTKSNQRNCSPLTLHNTVHCTKHICTPSWPGGRFSLSRYDGGNRVSDRILLVSIPC